MHLQRFLQTNPKHLHRTQKGFLCPCHSDHLRHPEKGGTTAWLTLVFENNIKRFLLVSFSPSLLAPFSLTLSPFFIILHPIFIQDMIINICPGSRFIYTGAKRAGNFTHGRQHDLGSDRACRFFFLPRTARLPVCDVWKALGARVNGLSNLCDKNSFCSITSSYQRRLQHHFSRRFNQWENLMK